MILSTMMSKTPDRLEIVTITNGIKPSKITTGNGNIKRLNYANLHSRAEEIPSFTVSEKIIQLTAELSSIKDSMIVDFSNEDPKIFSADKEDYFEVASKRGYIFNLAAIVTLVLLLWLFVIRIALGDCGGYTSIIRKPTKSDRVKVYLKITLGTAIFVGSFVGAMIFVFKDQVTSKESGELLNLANAKQSKIATDALSRIRELNSAQIEVIYSSLSSEQFKIGIFLKPLIRSYKRSETRAKSVTKELFEDTKNHIFVRILIILLIVSLCLVSYIYSYKNRVLTKSLMIAACLGCVGVFTLNTMNTQFNNWSIFVELCQKTVSNFDNTKIISQKYGNSLNKLITCLNTSEKELLKQQMVSLLVAENTILNILRNFFKSSESGIEFSGSLDSIKNLNANRDIVYAGLTESATKTGLELDHLTKIYNASKEINLIYNELEYLDVCYEEQVWSDHYNNKVCERGIEYQYYSLFALFGVFIGIIILAASMFSSENVIRGLYNEEIQYVKTNKLRYDWN